MAGVDAHTVLPDIFEKVERILREAREEKAELGVGFCGVVGGAGGVVGVDPVADTEGAEVRAVLMDGGVRVGAHEGAADPEFEALESGEVGHPFAQGLGGELAGELFEGVGFGDDGWVC